MERRNATFLAVTHCQYSRYNNSFEFVTILWEFFQGQQCVHSGWKLPRSFFTAFSDKPTLIVMVSLQRKYNPQCLLRCS